MRVLLINSTCGIGSTGRICTDLWDEFNKNGDTCVIAYGRGTPPEKYQQISRRIGNNLDVYVNVIKNRILDNQGLGSKKATREFLKWANEYNPDLLWLHNIHGYYINYELLFDWIKSRPQMEVKWTLHDCWSFTGHCSYFSEFGCEKWQNQCENCPLKRDYPESIIFDKSKKNFAKKKSAFSGISNMTLIVPSHWLANLVKKSFLSEYPIEVHYNKVNKQIFKPTISNIRKKLGIENKFVILGVANIWTERKGLGDFIELSKMLDKDDIIVLVGLSKKQIENLPENIIGIERTDNLDELVKLYSCADVYYNPSREETFGMTTLEATLCGTLSVVHKNTACEEIVNQFGGIAISRGTDSIYSIIQKLKEGNSNDII